MKLKCDYCGEEVNKCGFHNCECEFKKEDVVCCFDKKHFCNGTCVWDYICNSNTFLGGDGMVDDE